MAELNLSVELRGDKTRGELNGMRAGKRVPGVVYGEGKDPIPVSVSLADVKKVQETGMNTILHLKHEKGVETALMKDVQFHPVSEAVLHVDFQRISMTHKIDVGVPIYLKGESKGVKLQGGILEHLHREVELRALPNKIPHDIVVDVSGLEIGDGVLMKDLPLPEGCELLSPADEMVVNVLAPRKEEEPAPEEAAAGGAEPELSVAKGKKEEEGAEGAKPKEGAKGKEEPKKETKK